MSDQVYLNICRPNCEQRMKLCIFAVYTQIIYDRILNAKLLEIMSFNI